MIVATGGTKELISCIKQAQVWIKDAQAIALIRQGLKPGISGSGNRRLIH
jgi:hypothetical protein